MPPQNSSSQPDLSSQIFPKRQNAGNYVPQQDSSNDHREPPMMPPIPPKAPYQPISPRKSHRGFIIGLIIILLFIGGTAYAGYTFVISPDWVIPHALSNIDDAGKLHTNLTLSLASSSAMYAGSKLEVTSNIDRSHVGSPAFQTLIDLSATQFSGAAEIRLVNDTLYGMVTKLPQSLLQSAGNMKILNTWYSIKLDTLKKYSTVSSLSSTTEALTQSGRSLETSYNKLHDAGVISDVTFLGVTNEAGSYERKYSLTINKQKLGEYIVSEYKKSRPGEAYPSSISIQLEQIEFSPIIITTSLVTGSLRSVSVGVTSDLPIGYGSQTGANSSVTLQILAEYDDQKTDFNVTPPENAMSLDSLINQSLQPKSVSPIRTLK